MMHAVSEMELPRKTNETELVRQLDKTKKDVQQLGRIAGTQAKDKLRDLRDRGAKLSKELRGNGRQAVERHPVAFLGAAAGLGFLAGLLLRKS